MSIWYQYNVTCYARDRVAVAKFFNLQPTPDEVRTDMFEFSFGGKNAPGLKLGKLITENPGLIFLIKQSVEVDSINWWVCRFDMDHATIPEEGIYQSISLYSANGYQGAIEVNKKILEEYAQKYPTLAAKHIPRLEGFRWDMFFNDFDSTSAKLKKYKEYGEMTSSSSFEDIEFENDYSHLVDYD